MKRILLLTTLLFIIPLILPAQNTVVQSFNYESTTRDTMIDFPEGDHTQYEKILMHYAMRCKDGLVSNGNDTNRGCGEWDYSCNTYVVDSTKVDSIKATSDEFRMPGYGADIFEATTTPTYDYFEVIQKNVEYTSVLIEKEFDVISGSDDMSYGFGQKGSQVNLTYILTVEELEDAGVGSQKINGMTFPITEGEATLKNLRINILATPELKVNDAVLNGDWHEACYSNTTLSEADNLVKFYDDFSWDGTSNLAFNISYDHLEGDDLNILGSDSKIGAMVNDLSDESYFRFSPGASIEVDNGIEEISDQITIAYWINGANNLPVNTTSIEAVDDANVRQINIHHPWSNGHVYWDCGNDGGGYDRINKPADQTSYKNGWNHWAFTKNANTGEMKIYLNGSLWHEGTDKFKNIDAKALTIGGAHINDNLHYYGGMDEVQVWNTELDESTIQDWMNKKITNDHPAYDNLVLYYDFNGDLSSGVEDKSNFDHPGVVAGQVSQAAWPSNGFNIRASLENTIPNHALRQDVVFTEVTDIVVLDSLLSLPQKVEQYGLEGTDLVLLSTDFYYPAGYKYVTNEDGDVVDSIFVNIENTIEKGLLNYYNKTPMAFEIMSFVTPYGINLDLGINGHSWTFDVTDFGPILKGQKRIFMSRGGQWQEDMDISFEFIKGVPDRDVLDINQIWRVDAVDFQRIHDDTRYEPREFTYDPNVSGYVIKTAITGHRQEGEFTPRSHTIDVGGFNDTWTVWKECADNPIYPQGGTWIYDRAGWCPGEATDVRTFDVSQYFQLIGNPVIDYNVGAASGSNNYIVNSQLITYGPPNKARDLAIEDVVYPSTKIEHGRFNPSCQAPKVVIKNHGSETINDATIKYGVVGKIEKTFNWTGQLGFLGTEEVTLDFIPGLLESSDGDMFFASVSINGGSDEYSANDEYVSEIELPDYYQEDIVLEFRTNSRPQETLYRVFDDAGNQLLYRGGNLSANTTYRDTLRDLNGCYKIVVEDSDDDGISFWANGDGNGYLRLREVGSTAINLATDFGKFIEYNFTSGIITSNDDLQEVKNVSIFPNPGFGEVYFSNLDSWQNEINLTVTDQMGRLIFDGKKAKQDLSSGMSIINGQETGVYYLKLQDKERSTIVKYMKVSEK